MSTTTDVLGPAPARARTTNAVLELDDVSRSYRSGTTTTVALDHVSLRIDRGELVAIVGPSGSGKSTLMNIVGCLDRPTSGRVRVAGQEVADLGDNALTDLRGRSIGFVFQQFQLLPSTSARDNVAAALLYQGVPRREARRRASAVLDRLGLGDRLHHDRTQLSGGQQQRVAIARAIVTEPDLVLADEPTGALDSRTGAEVLDLFDDLHREGRTVVVITHDLEVAGRAERRIHVRDGRIDHDERVPRRMP